jgi:hypothetical protein
MQLLLWFLIGLSIGRLSLPIGSLSVGSLYLMPIHLSLLGMLLIGSRALTNSITNTQKTIWAVCVGITAAQLVPELMRTGNGSDQFEIGDSWEASLLLAVVGIAATSFVCRTEVASSANGRTRAVACATILLVISGYRLGHLALSGLNVRNEERSLFIGEIEIHHITVASVLLWMVFPWRTRVRASAKWPTICGAILLGSIADEYVYMLDIGHVIDADGFYSSEFSLLGALLMTGVVCWLICCRRCDHNTELSE